MRQKHVQSRVMNVIGNLAINYIYFHLNQQKYSTSFTDKLKDLKLPDTLCNAKIHFFV